VFCWFRGIAAFGGKKYVGEDTTRSLAEWRKVSSAKSLLKFVLNVVLPWQPISAVSAGDGALSPAFYYYYLDQPLLRQRTGAPKQTNFRVCVTQKWSSHIKISSEKIARFA